MLHDNDAKHASYMRNPSGTNPYNVNPPTHDGCIYSTSCTWMMSIQQAIKTQPHKLGSRFAEVLQKENEKVYITSSVLSGVKKAWKH